MIKNLFEQDEYQPEKNKTERGEKTATDAALKEASEPQYIEVNEAENLFDTPEVAFEKLDDSEKSLTADELENLNSFVETTGDTPEFSQSPFDSPEKSFPEATDETKGFSAPNFDSFENSLNETPNEPGNFAPPVKAVNKTENSETSSFESPAKSAAEALNDAPSIGTADSEISFQLPHETKIEEEKPAANNEPLFQPLGEPESFAETARKSGLAYAAAITLTASIVFMLIIGWFADLLFGSSPWGIVGGIIFGSLIGFVQFFRMTAQIFKNKD